MKYIVALALVLCSFVGSVEAQFGPPGPDTTALTAADTAKLPFSIELKTYAPGWTGEAGMWATAIWNRVATGAWYRNPQYPNIGRNATATVHKINHMSTSSYTCYVASAYRFRCRDNVRGLDRYFDCPATIGLDTIPYNWRSDYLEAPNSYRYFFTWGNGAASRWLVRTDYHVLQRLDYRVTSNGKQINCSYKWPSVVDVWVWWR